MGRADIKKPFLDTLRCSFGSIFLLLHSGILHQFVKKDYKKVCEQNAQLLRKIYGRQSEKMIYMDEECEADFERGFRLGAIILFELLDTEM